MRVASVRTCRPTAAAAMGESGSARRRHPNGMMSRVMPERFALARFARLHGAALAARWLRQIVEHANEALAQSAELRGERVRSKAGVDLARDSLELQPVALLVARIATRKE